MIWLIVAAVFAAIAVYAQLYFQGVGRLYDAVKKDGFQDDPMAEMRKRVWTWRWLFLMPGLMLVRVYHLWRKIP
jgi:hypothetical protein